MRELTEAEFNELIDELYVESSEDIVGLWEVVKMIEDLTGPDSAAQDDRLMTVSLAIVCALLAKGLQAGDPPYQAGGYNPWPNQKSDAIVDRIRREWKQLGHAPSIPDIVWFGRR